MQFNWPLIGHENIKRYFEKAFSGGRVHHAYLFEGPEQVGKTTFARMLSKTLLCEQMSVILSPDAPVGAKNPVNTTMRSFTTLRSVQDDGGGLPCNQCRACEAFDRGAHPDFLVFERGEKGHYEIESVREHIAALSRRPLLGKALIGIIEEASLLLGPAANALLKTLEEPAPAVTLFLTTKTEVLPTIVSRCQHIRFSFVPERELKKAVGQNDDAEGAVAFAAGRPGWMIKMRVSGAREEFLRAARTLTEVYLAEEAKQFCWLAETFGKSGGNLRERRDVLEETLNQLEFILREALFQSYRPDESGRVKVLGFDFSAVARKKSGAEIAANLRRVREGFSLLRANVDPHQIGEYIFLNSAAQNG